MILVGGQALRELGHDRHTNDVDYLVNDTTTKQAFITSDAVDYLNANGNKFFGEIYIAEKGNSIASPQSLLELKAYAFVQHCQNFNFAKADTNHEINANSEREAVEKIFQQYMDGNYFPQDDGSIKDGDGHVIAKANDNMIEYDGGYFGAEEINE